ncbi:Mov34/MPN/PAD-1 family protein [Candidatus Magnetominusculus xianensis]|uniref:Mov34/MPN/PAD-1 family protein n=1 Tax=Candidatus Magnetominusculus xianensis TaxID=1748249 RepID=A0ABR5SDZ1_9BACT|nr:Mov34/MPN/PAD-1 family protein [Candidatus Magnetominusculus xianensis]KWT82481.1 Mov34/MPN/PAD-1 family protein [Candidatus Magnetominusculus xianensis]MBF0403201.1 Mov34/MPN/PAD-1 family protein [Nitrospirota bacterium]
MTDTFVIHNTVLDEIFRHALEAYPEECCGVIINGTVDGEERQVVRRFQNIQNYLHKEDPLRYPFTASIAYTVDRKEADSVFALIKENGQTLAAFYHSHPDHPAFFSEEDKAAQTVFGEPEFPEVAQIVISLTKRSISGINCFKWNQKDFSECRLKHHE